jgi:3-methyladenine DNA glycosylase AlkC
MGGLAAALEPLELLARVDLLADRLARVLPGSFPEAVAVLWRALESPTFTGWMTLPCGTFVARSGIDEPEIALPLLAGLTPRWSSEAPIRPFIERHAEVTYDHLRRWCDDDDEHVRRLVSEGTRPRLPWAPLLRGLIADPSPNLPLLDALVDDPSPYVRRSVANHLNDITKDHPALALDLAAQWVTRGDGPTWVVRHGLRSLVKRGDARALGLLGIDTTSTFELVDLVLDQERIAIGDAVSFTFTLVLPAGSEGPRDAIIDYRIHYAGARGTKAPKVFKLTRRTLEPGRSVTIIRRHRFEHVSIRPIHPGRHTIDIQVNGVVLGSAAVDVDGGDH